MAYITADTLFKAVQGVDLQKLHEEGKTLVVAGQECDPKYLMYLVEHLTGTNKTK